ncbi:MAG: hypothetical protein HUU29_10925 [Planctomycetaceae bacterium]|nr:hypothetical protein [Planctomycetaceae bacterium]
METASLAKGNGGNPTKGVGSLAKGIANHGTATANPVRATVNHAMGIGPVVGEGRAEVAAVVVGDVTVAATVRISILPH